MTSYWIVWNCEEKNEGVIFDNEKDARQTSTGNFTQMSPAIGEDFFDLYEEDSPLPVQKIEILSPDTGER